MNTAVIITKTDPEVKRQAQALAKELGISLSSMLNGYLRQVIKTKRVTFSSEDEEPSEYLIKLMRDGDKALKAGKASPSFDNAKDAIDFLEKQGI